MTKDSSIQYWTTDRIMRLILTIAIGAVLLFLINYLSTVLLPFVAACLVAYLMEPLVRLNMRWTRSNKRVIGAALAIIEVSVVLAGAIYLFVPTIIKDIDELGVIIHRLSTGSQELPPFYRFIVDFSERYFDADSMKHYLSGDHIEVLLSKGSSLLEESLSVVVHILAWLLMFIYIIFVLIDYPQIVRGFKLIFPRKYRPQAWGIVREVQDSMNSYFRGQGLLALIAMVFYCTGFSIVGLPLAIPMGLLVGTLYMIPYFQYVTIIPVAIICVIYSLGGAVEFLPEFGKCLLVYAITQGICDYIITPHVMGKEMGLNPAMILLALSVWGSLLGIIGMIIALPATALIMSYYERYISNRGPKQQISPESQTPPPYPEKK